MDTCIWASFFGKPSSLEKHAVDNLIDMDRIALVGPILAEVLLGFRRKDQADWVGSRLVLSTLHRTDAERLAFRCESGAEPGRQRPANPAHGSGCGGGGPAAVRTGKGEPEKVSGTFLAL